MTTRRSLETGAVCFEAAPSSLHLCVRVGRSIRLVPMPISFSFSFKAIRTEPSKTCPYAATTKPLTGDSPSPPLLAAGVAVAVTALELDPVLALAVGTRLVVKRRYD